jgi:hypothetical protein
MSRQRRARSRWWLTLALCVTLVTGLLQGAVAGPATAQDPSEGRPKVSDPDHPLAVHALPAHPTRKPAQSHPKTPPKAAWPAAGTATATVPEQAGKATGRAIRPRLGKLPLALRAPKLPSASSGDGLRDTGKARQGGTGKGYQVPVRRVAKAQVSIVGRKTASRAGVDGMVLTVRRADSVTQPGKVGLDVDYSSYAQAYGGAYGARLHLVQLPACALTTPDRPGCRTQKPVAATNDTAHRTLSADAVTLPGQDAARSATVLAVTASDSSDHGDYKATSLSPSSTWQTDLNSGQFAWTYDMPAPKVPGDLTPKVSLSYSSGAIDGRTGTTNNQASWVGDGFDLWSGSIQRSYVPCADQGVKIDGNESGDLCWGYDNATLTLNGASNELIPAGSNVWRLKKDDGTRVEHLTGSSTDARDNGDNDQEYWRVTTTDGTQYYFGYNKLPGWSSDKETTDSTWTVPVYGNDEGEPCHAATFADSWCQQAWQWNLDYVVDTHGNAIAYYYDTETDNYSRNFKVTDGTPYDRGGSLDRIGQHVLQQAAGKSRLRHGRALPARVRGHVCGGHHRRPVLLLVRHALGPALRRRQGLSERVADVLDQETSDPDHHTDPEV